MARKLNITLRGTTYEVEPVKLERKKLYGWVETRVTTPERGCLRVSFAQRRRRYHRSRRLCVKQGIITDDGNWAERSEFITVDAEGKFSPWCALR